MISCEGVLSVAQRIWAQPWLGGLQRDPWQWRDALLTFFLCGVAPKMARACACLSLDAMHILFVTVQLIQQWTCLTYARHVLVETGTIRSEIANGHVAYLVYALHV